MSNTPKNIKMEIEVSVKINCGLLPILNRAEKDSNIPTKTAKTNCTNKNSGIDR